MKRLSAIVSLCGVLALTACGGSPEQVPTTSGMPQVGDRTCFQQLDTGATTELARYAQRSGDTITADSAADDDTVCVIDGDNSMRTLHNDDDQFAKYWLMSMMMGRDSNPLLMYGVLTDEISPLQAFILGHAYGMNPDGFLYRPYSQQGGNWYRNTTPTTVKIKNVYYGKDSSPQSLDDYKSGKRPSNWKESTRSTSMPLVSDVVGRFGKNGQVTADPSMIA